MTIHDDKNREVLMGVDLARPDGGDATMFALVGKDAKHSAIVKYAAVGSRGIIEEIVRHGITSGHEAGSVAREIWKRGFMALPAGPAYFDAGNYDSYGRKEERKEGGRIEWSQQLMVEFPGMNEKTIRESAIDYAEEARRRALRTMRGAEVSIDGVVVGRIDEIQIEHNAPSPIPSWGGDMFFLPRHPGFATGVLKFHADEAALNHLWEGMVSERNMRGGMVPARRKKAMAEPKPYEKKNIVALVYRTYPTIEAIEAARSAFHGGPIPPATRDADAQMRFIGYVYAGETPEQIINADTENSIRVNEDRTYLVYDAPGVIEVEGPKSRMTVRRKGGASADALNSK
jgi:hypothetical protein